MALTKGTKLDGYEVLGRLGASGMGEASGHDVDKQRVWRRQNRARLHPKLTVDGVPDLVAYEPYGKPYTVKYQYLTTMLLNEVQKQYHRAEAEATVITDKSRRSRSWSSGCHGWNR